MQAGRAHGASSLHDILARPDIWRGDALAVAPMPGVATGFAALDAQLPGGGWPRGGLVELMVAQKGVGELSLLMPALARLSAEAWVVCIAPPQWLPFAPAWAAAGVDLAQLILVRVRGVHSEEGVWACSRALDTAGIRAVLAWLPSVSSSALRRLQIQAERNGTLLFVFRPLACGAQSSPAPLRLSLVSDAGGTQARRLLVHVLKRRGGVQSVPLCLDMPGLPVRERRSSSALVDSVKSSMENLRHVVAKPGVSAFPA